jgi:hypothetical protein
MTMREVPYEVAAPGEHRARAVAALVLHTVGRALEALAYRLVLRPARTEADPMFEFHAEAGAPEGALYVDGVLVGRLQGVTRL